MIHIFWFLYLFVPTASADLSEAHKNSLIIQLENYCENLAFQKAQTTFDAETQMTRSSIQHTTCSYNPFSSCEFALRCEYLLATYSTGSERNLHRGYLTLKVYQDEGDALKNNENNYGVHTLTVGGKNYYVAHSIDVLELFFIEN